MGMKFDGKQLKDGSTVIANVRGDKIYEKNSSSTMLANVRGDKLYEKNSSSTVLANIRSGKVYDKNSSSTKKDTFDGHQGSAIHWALWYLCCR